MENRDRDRVSQRSSPTEAGGLNRKVEEEKGREHNKGTTAEFGQNVGRSENLEGGNMGNRNDERMNRNIDSEVNDSGRRSSGSSYDSSSGRSGSVSSNKNIGSDKLKHEDEFSRGESRSDKSGSMGNSSKY